MRYYALGADFLMEVRRNDADSDPESFVANLADRFPEVIYFGVAPS